MRGPPLLDLLARAHRGVRSVSAHLGRRERAQAHPAAPHEAPPRGTPANPRGAANWRGAQMRSMKSDGSKMKSSYSSAFMYSPSTYWYIASSGEPVAGPLERAVAERLHRRGRVGEDGPEVEVRLEVVLERVAGGARGGVVVHRRLHRHAAEVYGTSGTARRPGRGPDAAARRRPARAGCAPGTARRAVISVIALLSSPSLAVQAVASRTAAWASRP